MKKFKKLVITGLCICSLGITANAATNTVTHFSTQKITQLANDKLQQEDKTKTNNLNSEIYYAGTGYNEGLVGYDSNHTFIDKEAFQVAEFTFDTHGHPDDYKEVTVSYSGGDSVQWTHNGSATAGTKLFTIVEAEISYSISKSSTISTTITASAPYKIKKNSTGVVPIYAYGYKTNGALKYKWWDMSGRTGYRYEDFQAYLPYKKYKSSHIKFGRLTYE